MNKRTIIIDEEYKLDGIDRFLDNLSSRKCIYYASDFLNATEDDVKMVEDIVMHTLEVFRTLNIPTENHFSPVYRGAPAHVTYRDWKVSELACAYMLMNGDPTDLKTIAMQQTELIGRMLQHGRRV